MHSQDKPSIQVFVKDGDRKFNKESRSEKMAKKEYMPLLENIASEAWSSQEKFRVESQRGLIHRTRLAFALKVYVVTSAKAVPAAPRTQFPRFP